MTFNIIYTESIQLSFAKIQWKLNIFLGLDLKDIVELGVSFNPKYRIKEIFWQFYFNCHGKHGSVRTVCTKNLSPTLKTVLVTKWTFKSWIRSFGTYIKDHENRNELRECEGHSELEGGECRDHGGAAFGDEIGDAADVNVGGGEGRGHRGLGHWQRNAGVRGLQGAAVVATVTAHDHLPAKQSIRI